ncbi:HAMP domain-containing histidine kinase [Halomonas sp. H33-56]|uniref:sensor histidine kinase n=1 Tax=unclassified Halomonas TaxID=2609666 RepID=UPI001C97A3EE|nr:HAMP domain-containing sensor histidine kinase [Halomonas sp. DP1Y21-3]MBY6110390.1 HAMP domain-containing histidine kinase [Halomonas sp. DP1Y21-3]
MKIISVVTAYTLVLLTMACTGAVLAYWSVERSTWLSDRMNLAHHSYEAHLNLSTHSYRLFKQYADALLIGDQDGGEGERRLQELVRQDISEIRDIIGAEIELVGDEEVEELELLARLEDQLDEVIRGYAELLDSERELDPVSRWLSFYALLDEAIDERFRKLMDVALEGEIEEVREAREELARGARQTRWLALGFALLAVVLTVAVMVFYRWRVSRRFQRLMAGVERMHGGAFGHAIKVSGGDELGRISRLLNQMGADVHSQRRALERQNSALEEAVADRTGELERLLEEARRAERHRRRLLADVSHELRTPLTIIQGECDVVLRARQPDEDDYREALRRAREAAGHTAALIDDLLTIARQESGELRLQPQPTELVEFLKDVISLSSVLVSLETEVTVAPVEVDRLRLRQSVLALLQNARVHGGPRVVVRLWRHGGGWRIAVEDDGRGVSAVDKAVVFERFYRGANASTNYTEGSGLGLPIVRAIARAHGGDAGLEDRPGGGLIVYIDVPGMAEESTTT